MKKRVLSMLLAFILCFSTLPMTAFAQGAVQEADVVTEKEEQQTAALAAEQEEAEAAAASGAETSSDKSTTVEAPDTEDSTAGEAPDTVEPSVESVSDSDAGTQGTGADDEKKAAVQKVQALIDALPETVTVENAESVSAQLEAIDEAMAELTEEQTDQLDMARYAALCAAAVALTAEQSGEHVHPICGATCTDDEVHENVTWTGVSELTNNMAAGNYYLTGNITLTEVWAPVNNVNLCLNGYNIEYTPVKNNTDADRFAIDVEKGVTVSLCDAHGSGTVNSTKNFWNSCVRAWLGTINLYGGVTLSAYNTGVSINAGGRFDMYGGTVTGKNWGVNVAEGYFAMHSGEISGSESYGGVYVSGYNTTEFTMTGGKICNNKSSKSDSYGGGVTVNHSNNSVPGIFTMTGGEISGNTAQNGGGVYIGGSSSSTSYPGSFTMTGGTISGNTATKNGGGVYIATDKSTQNTKMITVGGDAKIAGNTSSNVYLADNNTIAIAEGGLKNDANIGVTLATAPANNSYSVIANGADNGYAANNIVSDNNTYKTQQSGDEVLLYSATSDLHIHPVCGETCNHTGDAHGDLVWTGISDLSKITGPGNYYLTEDVTLTSGVWNCDFDNENVNLCLNGKTITGADGKQVIEVNKKTSLTITDCQETSGKITHVSSQTGAGIEVYGTLTLWNGNIVNNTVQNQNGAGVWASGTATFNMNGGTISGNKVDSENLSGGGVFVGKNSGKPEDGTFNMTGGIITGNTSGDGGGGVYMLSGTFNMTGGTITGNNSTRTEYDCGGGVYLYGAGQTEMKVSGTVQITDNWWNGTLNKEGLYEKGENGTASNVYLPEAGDRAVAINVEKGFIEKSRIGISKASINLPIEGNYVTVATSEADNIDLNSISQCFSADAGNSYNIKKLDDKLVIVNGVLHEHPVCGATCNHTGDKHGDLVWTGISDLSKITGPGNYYLTNDIKLTQVWTPVNNVNLCLNGYNIEYTPVKNNTDADIYAIDVEKGVTVSLCDAYGSGTVNSTKNSWNSCVRACLGTINLYDGVTLSAYNTGVYIDEAGHFNMYGGTVTGKSTGVNVVNSYFAMHGGEISGSENYGGVYVFGDNKPQFIMTGGKICNNESSISEGYGGGVTVNPGKNGPGIFIMTGGEISNNKALCYGGGVNIGCSGTEYFYPGSFTMTGGTISGNTATENGGGVFVATNKSSKDTKMITVGGNAKITGNTGSNVYLCDNNTIAIDEDGLKDDARIGVTTAAKPTLDNKIGIASNAKDDLKYTDIFTSDVTGENYTIVKDGTNLYLAAHEHSWVYTAQEAVITAKCSGCGADGGSVTLTAPKDPVYNGNDKIAAISFSENWQGPAVTDAIQIYYTKENDTNFVGLPVGVGTYEARISINNENAKPATARVKYTIQKATLTVTAGDCMITYGANPEDAVEASATFEGFANDADQKALEFTPKYTYDYTQYGNVGNYTITPGVPDGLKLDEKLPNYDVKFVPGKLTVMPYTVILDWKNIENRIYGDGQGAIKGVVYCLEHDSGLVSAEIEGADLTAGTHTARVTRLTGERAGNYKLPENPTHTYTVAKAKQTLEFKASATEVTYDENIIIDNKLKETSNYSTNVIYDSSNPKVVTVDKDGSSHVVGVGTATITATAVETENYERAQATCTVTVTPKPVTISGIKVQNKTYDGTTAASIDLSNAKIDGGVSYTLQIDATNAKAVFEDANAGTDKTVTFTGFALTGADAGNYELSEQPDNVKADITRATITVTPEADQAKTYRENDPASLAYTASGAISGEKPSFTGVLGREAGENVDSYVINKATPVIKVTDKILVKNGNAVDISTWASFDNTDAGAKLIYELADAYEGITLEDNKLTAVNADTTAESFVMTVTAGATTNFTAPEEKRFNVKVVEKEDAEVKIDAPTTKTYGDADFTLKATTKAADNGTWSWESSNDSVLKIVDGADTATPTIQVGSADADGATLTATYSSDAYYGTAFVTIKVAPKAITADMISEIPAQKYTGKAIQPVPYVTDDETALVSGKDFELSYSDNNINVGTATVTITGSGNYTGKQDKSFAIEPKSIDGAEITLVSPSFEYNGSEQTVEIVSVTLPDGTVLAESDYKIKDDSNKATNAATDLLLTIEGTGNYTGIATRYWMISKIDPKQADFDMVPDLSAEQTYSGEAQIVNVTTKSGIRGMGAVTVRYNGRTEAPTNVGSYAITIDVADGSNYKAISGIEAGTLTIKKAAAPTLADVKADHAYATTGAQTVSLADLVAGATDYKLGEIAENETITGETVSENGVVTYTLTGKGAAGSTVTIPVTITSKNYEETTVNVVITIKQATPTGAPGYEFLHDSSKTLKDAGLDLINSTLNPKEGTLEWIDSNGKVLPGETKLEEGKKYIWRFTPDDSNYATITGELELYAPYRILDGADSTWTQGTDGTIAIRGNGDFEKFQSVKVDGAVVDAKYYTVAKGSTIITFKGDYLKTLSTGSHTFELVWTDGSAATKFTIAAKPDNGDNNNDSNDDSDNDITVNGNVSSGNNTVPAAIDAPNTGDASGIWMTLFAVSLAGLAAMLVRKKNNRE